MNIQLALLLKNNILAEKSTKSRINNFGCFQTRTEPESILARRWGFRFGLVMVSEFMFK